MVKKSSLKEKKCLVATLKPVMLMGNDNSIKSAQDIEGLYRYVVELFDGIARNESNSFSGKFDFSVLMTPSRFLIYKEVSGQELTEKEYEKFITAIAIFQMVFIDENIYLTGNVSEKTIIVSNKGIIWGIDEKIDDNEISVCVEKKLSEKYSNKYVTVVEGKNIVDFLETVYRFSPFKEEKGNMMRHIINPIKSVRKGNEKLLCNIIKYCNDYIKIKKFDFDL